MTVIESILLGIIQGITEFLPVSSSGHLAVLQNVFHMKTSDSMLFEVMLHLGTLAAVLLVYHRDIWKMICEIFGMVGDIFRNLYTFSLNKIHKTSLQYRQIVHNNYRKFVLLILISTIPTAIIGFLLRELAALSGKTLLIPGIAFLITGVLLLMTDTAHAGHKMPKTVTFKDGLIIGAVQGVAVLPGLSRSGTTIAACVLCGLDRRFAVKYSFIMSVPAILGAALLECTEISTEAIDPAQIGIYAIGMVFAAVVGYVCMKTVLIVIKNKKFQYFAWYCFALGAIAIAAHFFV